MNTETIKSPLKKRKAKIKTKRSRVYSSRGNVKLKQSRTKTPKKPRGLTSEQVKIASRIKKINERINQLEKRGFTGVDAYKKIVSAKYGEYDIITTKKGGQRTPTSKSTVGGGLKIRTDVGKMTPEELNAVVKLMDDFEKSPSTITEIRKQKKDVFEYKKIYEEEPETVEDITDDELNEYLDLVDRISADAIARAFYMKEYGFSEMYERSLEGESYKDLKKEIINDLVYLYKYDERYRRNNIEPYDEDLIKLYYNGV